MRSVLRVLVFVLMGSSLLQAQGAPKRPAISGIAFVSFLESDAAAATRFYRDELGLRAVQAGGQTLYPVNRSQWIATAEGGPDARNSREAAVGLTTSDVHAMQRYLQAKGVAAVSPVRNGQFAVHDPEGNTIVFVQRGSQAEVAHSAPSPRAISRRVIHAGFVVKNEAAENAFYRDVLGFRPYWRGGMKDGVTDFVSQQVPDGTDWIEFMLNVRPEASAAQRGVSNHVSLGVTKMETAIAQLKANGCSTKECSTSQMGRDGKVQLNLYDPEHSRVEVMEFAPSGPTCCSPYTGPMPKENDPQ